MHLLECKEAVATQESLRLSSPVSLTIEYGDQIALLSPNGGGKSLLVDLLLGNQALDRGEIQWYNRDGELGISYKMYNYLEFRDTYGTSADNQYFYQQRYSRSFQDDTMPMVNGKPLIALSSGELRRYHLEKAIATHPELLILDNPYIGLDKDAREELTSMLTDIALKKETQIIIVVSRIKDIPPFINRIIGMRNRTFLGDVNPDIFEHENSDLQKVRAKADSILKSSEKDVTCESEDIIDMENLCINYGNKKVLDNVKWSVKRGEHWVLRGRNGAGKSTLLSVVCADHPQSYACEFSLFGQMRGTGESIWDIKKRIGYFSPELHRSYYKPVSAMEIVSSGLTDSIGVYKEITEIQSRLCQDWMEVFGIKDLADKNFMKLSSGEQGLILLCRAFVKNPELLILDEPFHGLDESNRERVHTIIDAYCAVPSHTYIMVSHYAEEIPKEVDHVLDLTPKF